ncbi:septum site-determining protein Ssd [Saccharomonospora sp. NPDC046836]|uniref:septum site-determining protein Ssd n=1 Tax=Saccharomonospora sp. NPDC046836 TaxID=3156921 RepID=UPI0033CAF8F3
MITADNAVLDEVLRLAAAVGCATECISDLGAARTQWASAPLVLIDEAAAAAGVADGLPRRSKVLVVCAGTPPATTWQHAFAVGAEDVVALPEGESTLVAAFADVVDEPSRQRGQVLAVLGSRGGAGASVLAAGVGLTAAKAGEAVLLVDCDPLGGGIDLLLGTELAAGLRWPELRVQAGRVAMSALDAALPARRYGDGGLAVLSCDRDGPGPTADAAGAVVDAGRRAGRMVVCDLPRQRGPVADAVLRRADLVVVVVPAEVRACVAAARVIAGLGDCHERVRVVVRGPAPGGLAVADVADAVGVPALGWVRSERTLPRAVERGTFDPRPRGALGVACRTVLDAMGTGSTVQ